MSSHTHTHMPLGISLCNKDHVFPKRGARTEDFPSSLQATSSPTLAPGSSYKAVLDPTSQVIQMALCPGPRWQGNWETSVVSRPKRGLSETIIQNHLGFSPRTSIRSGSFCQNSGWKRNLDAHGSRFLPLLQTPHHQDQGRGQVSTVGSRGWGRPPPKTDKPAPSPALPSLSPTRPRGLPLLHSCLHL